MKNFFTEPCLCFSIFGKLAAGYLAFRILYKAWRMIVNYILSPTFDLATDVKTFGKWAVVTGATDGIGKVYAEEMARKGMNLVLISRTASKLEDVAKEIVGRFEGTEVKVVVADFTDIGVYDHIQKQLQGLDIGVLVNNVGISYEGAAFLHELPEELARKMLIVNTFSVLFMMRMVLERMQENKRGLIINISSFSAHLPCPLLSAYGATKAFVRSLSRSVQVEYASKGIVVQCVSPNLVATKMSQIKTESFFVPGPADFVSSAMATIGLDGDVSGCLSHEIGLNLKNLFGDKISGDLFFRKFLKSKKKMELRKEREEAKSKEQ